jgi:hypothetical protein
LDNAKFQESTSPHHSESRVMLAVKVSPAIYPMVFDEFACWVRRLRDAWSLERADKQKA